MPSRDAKDKVGQVVRFTASEADQTLLQAVEQAMKGGEYESFSSLCKQALRKFLLERQDVSPPTPDPELRSQMATLQRQIARLEGAIGMQRTMSLRALEQQVSQIEQQVVQQMAQVVDRLDTLESRINLQPVELASPDASPPPPPEPDPLLDRLAPLLEDF
jgi:metal-responsive CopG/Arc/MetJ family transcriptional regulator